MKLYRVTLNICEACLKGIGEMCDTPECALFMHRVDIPIIENPDPKDLIGESV
jgi:hypothetical protein